MHVTIDPLFDKVDLLNSIRNDFNVVFTLEIVPIIYAGNANPCLAPSLKVIDFCHATRTTHQGGSFRFGGEVGDSNNHNATRMSVAGGSSMSPLLD